MTPSDLPFQDRPRRERIGRTLDLIGQVGLPLGIGALGGYFLSDRGVPLFPTMVESLLALGFVSLLFVALGRWLRGAAIVETRQGTRLRRRVVVAIVLAVGILGLRLFWHEAKQPTPLTRLSPSEFDRAFQGDRAQVAELDAGLARAVEILEGAESLAPDAPEEVLSADQEALLRDAWSAAWAHIAALDELRSFYEDYWRFDPSRADRSRHLRSFLLTFEAELSLFANAARIARLVDPHPTASSFLDAPQLDLGIPAASFSKMRHELLGSRDQARVVAGEQYMDLLELGFAGPEEAMGLGVGELWRHDRALLARIQEIAPIDRGSLTLEADAQALRRNLHRVWYPVQHEFSEKAGDARTRRHGIYLISAAQHAEMDAALLPGDIALARKNWYLSNMGLPGFWPHAILYLGAPEKLEAFFDDNEVKAWVHEQTGLDMSFGDLLARRYPAAWLQYTAGPGAEPGEEAHEYVVLEAISEGVSFNTWAHAAGDYLGVIRPKLDKVAKAQAIDAAFAQWSLPYDFNFDFSTDHAVVCTELVWRSYRPAEGKEGLDIPLVTIAGRHTLPANELARQYSETAGQPASPYEFVWFWDTSEAEQRALRGTEASFRESWKRPQWDQAQP